MLRSALFYEPCTKLDRNISWERSRVVALADVGVDHADSRRTRQPPAL